MAIKLGSVFKWKITEREKRLTYEERLDENSQSVKFTCEDAQNAPKFPKGKIYD